jgi:hypothetical protein
MRELKLLQYNVQKSKDKVMVPLFEDPAVADFDIVAIQEPWRNPYTPTTYNRRQGNFHLVFPPEGGRACIFINKRLHLDSWKASVHSPDLCSVSLKLGDQDLTIYSAYSQPPGNTSNTNFNSPIPLLTELLHNPGEHILLGDFNLHHPWWSGAQDPVRHEMADQLIDSVQLASLQLLLPKASVTWEARGGHSTIDLVFGTGLVERRLLECQVREDLDQGSDHYPIVTRIALEPQFAAPERRRSWKKADINGIQAGAQHLRRLCTGALPADINQYTDYLVKFIQDLAGHTVPWAKPSTRATPWWTPEIESLVRQERHERRIWTNTGDLQAQRRHQALGQEKKRAIAWEKRRAFREEVHAAAESPEGIWRLARWARLKGHKSPELPTMPTLQTANGRAETFDEKAEALSQRFFPESPADIRDIADTTFEDHTFRNPLPSMCHATTDEIRNALKTQKSYKAPGADGIPAGFLKNMGEPLVSALTSLATACWISGYYPPKLKEAAQWSSRNQERDHTKTREHGDPSHS